VQDIAPIKALSSLQILDLESTGVNNLSPLKDLTALYLYWHTDGSEIGGNENTEENREAVRAFIAAAIEAQPDTAPPEPPEQDELLRLHATEEGLEVEAALPSAEELEDPVRRTCLEQLTTSASTLAKASGNMHPDLSERARKLQAVLESELNDTSFLRVHLEIRYLQGVYERREELRDEETLTSAEVNALAEIVLVGPGLVRGDENVEKFEALELEPNSELETEEVDEAQRTVLTDAVEQNVLGPRAQDYAKHSKDAPRSSRWGLVRRILSKNFWIAAGSAVVSGIGGNSAYDLVKLIWRNRKSLGTIAKAMGEGAALWFKYVLEKAKEVIGEDDDTAD
jgi:hypothetical protein